jgi:hypothetical protein
LDHFREDFSFPIDGIADGAAIFNAGKIEVWFA